MAEDGVGNLQDALDLLDLALLEVELGDDVMPFPVVLDGVCEPTLTPRGDLLELASVRLDQLADLIDLLLDRLIVKLRLHDVHQLVCRQTRPPSCGICSGYGLAAAAEQESDRKSTKEEARQIKKRPPESDRLSNLSSIKYR